MSRVFISYKRADKGIVLPLKDKIEAGIGEECWIDLNGIESDAQFAEIIISAIDASEVVICMHSHHHAQIRNYRQDWTVREMNYAQQQKKRIVFIDLDHTPMSEWFSLTFPQQQMVDASSPDAIERLIENMRLWLNASTMQSGRKIYTDGLVYSYHRRTHEATLKEIEDKMLTNVVIPSVVHHRGADYKVTKIGYAAFEQCVKMKSIELPKGLKRIGMNAFSECISLQYISLPNGVEHIGFSAFDKCYDLQSVDIPSTVRHIGSFAFSDCKKLQSFVVPEGVRVIHSMTFSDCEQLSSISIPETVVWIKWFVFSGCNKLKEIRIPKWTLTFGFMTFDLDHFVLRGKKADE